MKAPAKQLGLIETQTDIEEAAEIEAGYLWRAELWSAMRVFAASYVDANGARGLGACAAALDRRWGPHGRPVSESTLGAALKDSERNNFRAEWLDWFARRSPEIAALLAHQVKPVKTDKELLADLERELRETMPKHADQVLRRARAR